MVYCTTVGKERDSVERGATICTILKFYTCLSVAAFLGSDGWLSLSSFLADIQPFLNFEDHWNFVQPYTVSPNAVCKSACTSSTVVMRLIPNLTYTQCFFLFLTMHLSITLANDQLDAQIFNTFITILYMFRSISCSSSGGQIVLI